MNLIQDLEFTTSGYITVHAPDGTYVSRHVRDDEAKESALKHAIRTELPEGTHQYVFKNQPETRMTVIIAARAGGNTQVGDVEPPLAPAGLSISNYQENSVQLDWAGNSEPDLASYKVYKSQGGEFGTYVFQSTVSAPVTTYVDPSYNAQEYNQWYKITALDNIGNESAFSGAMRATALPVSAVVEQPSGSSPFTGTYGPADNPAGVFFGRTDLSLGDTWYVDTVSNSNITVIAGTSEYAGGGVYSVVVPAGTTPGVYSFDWVLNGPSPATGTQVFNVS